METQFKNLPFPYSNYMISEDGKTIKRIERASIKQKEYISQHFQPVKGKEYPNGYMCATLYEKDYEVEGKVVRVPHFTPEKVHRLVAYAWLDSPPTPKHVWINHKDGNKLNNHYTNLEWTTISQNIQHAFDTGLKTIPKGADHWKYGKKASIETKMKMAAAKIGVNHPKFKGYYFANFKRYESANQAGKALEIPAKTVIARCKNDKWKIKGWYFLPVS